MTKLAKLTQFYPQLYLCLVIVLRSFRAISFAIGEPTRPLRGHPPLRGGISATPYWDSSGSPA